MTRKPSSKLPGRPRAFDESRALDAAMELFASKGYDATSLSELEDAMGINRVSLYGAFGNKEALFVKAMLRYTDQGNLRFGECLGGSVTAQSVRAFLEQAVEMFTNPEALGVCFITQAPMTQTSVSAETKRFVVSQRQGIEGMLAERLRRGVADGDLPRDLAIGDFARYFAGVVLGLALQAQHGATRADLLRVVDICMNSLPEAAAVSPRRKRSRG